MLPVACPNVDRVSQEVMRMPQYTRTSTSIMLEGVDVREKDKFAGIKASEFHLQPYLYPYCTPVVPYVYLYMYPYVYP